MTHATEFHEKDLLFSQQFEDHYYSRNDGRAETSHVFLGGNNLPERWAQIETFSIGELGFGTGLNFLETWSIWLDTRKPDQHLSFVSVEGFPIDVDTAERALKRWPELDGLAQLLLKQWSSLGQPIQLDAQTTLHVVHDHVEQALTQFPQIDAWYLDGFAPSRNPDMWSLEVLETVGSLTRSGGTCASYTAAGWVRRNLQQAGFAVEKRPGFGTKRDMIVGIKS